MVGGTHHDRVFPLKDIPRIVQQLHHAARGAWPEGREPRRQAAYVEGVKTVHVLLRGDTPDHRHGVYVVRQRRLHQDTVDGGVRIQLVHQLQQLFLGRAHGQIVRPRVDADPLARLSLLAHVDFGGRVGTRQDNSQAGDPLAPKTKLHDALPHLLQQIVCYGLAVQRPGPPVIRPTRFHQRHSLLLFRSSRLHDRSTDVASPGSFSPLVPGAGWHLYRAWRMTSFLRQGQVHKDIVPGKRELFDHTWTSKAPATNGGRSSVPLGSVS